jgi:hypothetical protein
MGKIKKQKQIIPKIGQIISEKYFVVSLKYLTANEINNFKNKDFSQGEYIQVFGELHKMTVLPMFAYKALPKEAGMESLERSEIKIKVFDEIDKYEDFSQDTKYAVVRYNGKMRLIFKQKENIMYLLGVDRLHKHTGK